MSNIKPEDILKSHTKKIQILSNILRKLIKQITPDVTEHPYPVWHAIGFRHKKAGYFCGVFPYKDHVKLIFEWGVMLPDPEKILQGDTKQVKFIIIKSKKDIKINAIKKLITESILLKTNNL